LIDSSKGKNVTRTGSRSRRGRYVLPSDKQIFHFYLSKSIHIFIFTVLNHNSIYIEIEVYEEIPEPHVIETGDSVKVKQVLDDATMEIIREAGYNINYSSENLKLFLMFLSCVSAMVAQFYPIPFPKSRILLGACCAAYFILSSILQFIISFVDKDTILMTQPNHVSFFLVFDDSISV